MSMFIGVNTNFYNNSLSTEGKPTTILARVDKVILGPLDASGNPDPDFKANGGWTSVGSIKYTVLYGSQPLPENSPTVAKPYAINSTHFPVKYEIVELVPGPSIKLNDDSLSKDLYYKKPINLWNNVYHNALPNALTLVQKNSTVAPTYQESIRGANYSATTSSKSISLGDTFPELNYIQNLQPFEGDYIVQGRFGQSIRFGSTVRKGVTLNPWSSAGTNGDPIVIIRNGQGDKRPADIFSNTIEDINKDGASIYLCSGQVVLIADLNAHTLDTFALGTTLQEPQVQRATTPLTSTDTKSPISQSNSELQYAQTSTETVIPSIVPQSKTTIQINQSTTGSTQSFIGPLQPTSSISQPTTGSNPTATVLTQTVMPDGTILNSSVNVLLDPFGAWNAGKIGVDAINNPNKVPYTPANQQTGSTLNNATSNTGQGTATTTQDVLPDGLEVIVADESQLRFTFDLDNVDPSVETEGAREEVLLSTPEQVERQKEVKEEKGDSTADGNWKSLNNLLQSIYSNRAAWKENGANTNVLKAFREVGAPQSSDSVPWCAGFVGYVLKTAGISYLKGNLSSIAYRKYGVEVPIDKPGEWRQWDIVVWAHTNKPGTGHVAFLNGVTGTGQKLSEQISALGGNQSNGVSISRYPYKGSDMKLLAIRRGPWTPPSTPLAKATGDIGGSTV